MSTILFFDDHFLHSRINLTRHVGQPEYVPEATFLDPYADVAWGYPSVIRDEESGKWRCYYQGEVPGKSRTVIPLMAESEDGMQWELPDLSDRLTIKNRHAPHQLLDNERFHEWCGVRVIPDSSGCGIRYVGMVLSPADQSGERKSYVVESRDGIEWSYVENAYWHPTGVDPGQFAYWNTDRQAYSITLRPSLADRRIALSETVDWVSFAEPELLMQADALDTPSALLYGMPVFPYEGMYIGFLWVYHTDPVVYAEEKFLSGTLEMQRGDDTSRILGKIDCQLSYSMNGMHFQRTERYPFIPNSPPGQFGSGCIYPSSMVSENDELRIYSSTSRGEHAQFRFDPDSQQAAITMHKLRTDGFVYLEPPGGTGELTTRWLLWESGELQLNISVPHGEALVQVMDAFGEPLDGYSYRDAVPITNDSTSTTVRWRDGSAMAALAGQIVRVGVRVTNGRVYAVKGDFESKTVVEARKIINS